MYLIVFKNSYLSRMVGLDVGGLLCLEKSNSFILILSAETNFFKLNVWCGENDS